MIIEMQVLNYKGPEKRILYNAAKNYSIQLKKGIKKGVELVARNLLASGLPVAKVMQLTGLSEIQVNNL